MHIGSTSPFLQLCNEVIIFTAEEDKPKTKNRYWDSVQLKFLLKFVYSHSVVRFHVVLCITVMYHDTMFVLLLWICFHKTWIFFTYSLTVPSICHKGRWCKDLQWVKVRCHQWAKVKNIKVTWVKVNRCTRQHLVRTTITMGMLVILLLNANFCTMEKFTLLC